MPTYPLQQRRTRGAREASGFVGVIRADLNTGTSYSVDLMEGRGGGGIGYYFGSDVILVGDIVNLTRRPEAMTWEIRGIVLDEDTGTDPQEPTGNLQYATTAEIADIAGTEAAGSSDLVPRGDHVHAHPGGLHIQGGAVEIDGDQIDIDFTPTDYTPTTAPAEVDDLNQLSAHTRL